MTNSSTRLQPLNPTGLSGTLTRPIASLRRRFKRQATRRTLMNLDDHILRDIGLIRGDIDAVLRMLDRR